MVEDCTIRKLYFDTGVELETPWTNEHIVIEICKIESYFFKCTYMSQCQTKYNRLNTFMRLKIQNAARQNVNVRQVSLQCRASETQVHVIHFNSLQIMLWHSGVLYWGFFKLPPFIVSTVFNPDRIPFMSSLCITALCWGFASLGAFALWRLADRIGGRRGSLWRSTSKRISDDENNIMPGSRKSGQHLHIQSIR